MVWDFRRADMEAGGVGAPLAPFFHQALVRRAGLAGAVAVLNLGGVANVTFVDPRHRQPESAGALLAFDCGPANSMMDDYMRDYIETKNPQKLSRLTGREAALAGQSVWNFIAQKYGKSNISNILNYTRIIRNEEKSIAITLGVSFNQMMYEWSLKELN